MLLTSNLQILLRGELLETATSTQSQPTAFLLSNTYCVCVARKVCYAANSEPAATNISSSIKEAKLVAKIDHTAPQGNGWKIKQDIVLRIVWLEGPCTPSDIFKTTELLIYNLVQILLVYY